MCGTGSPRKPSFYLDPYEGRALVPCLSSHFNLWNCFLCNGNGSAQAELCLVLQPGKWTLCCLLGAPICVGIEIVPAALLGCWCQVTSFKLYTCTLLEIGKSFYIFRLYQKENALRTVESKIAKKFN